LSCRRSERNRVPFKPLPELASIALV